MLSVSDMIRNSAVFLSPMVSRESSSYGQLLGAAVALAVAVRVGVVGVLISAVATRAGLRAPMLGIAVISPRAVGEAVTGVFVSRISAGVASLGTPVLRVGAVCPTSIAVDVIRVVVCRVPAVTAGLSPAMLSAVVVLPGAVSKAVAFVGCRAHVAVAGGAVVHDSVLGRGVLLILLSGTVAGVLVLTIAAVAAVGVATVLAAVVIFPIVVDSNAMADAHVHQVAAVLAELVPVAAVPLTIRPVVVAVIRLPASSTAATLSVAAERAGVAGEGVRALQDHAAANAAASAVDAVEVGIFIIGAVIVIRGGAVPGTGAACKAAVRSVRKGAWHECKGERKHKEQGY